MFKHFVDSDSTNTGGYERRRHTTNKTDEKTIFVDEEHLDKPCKACVDFKDWLKTGETIKSVEQQLSINSQCPLMRDDLGRASWSLLHTMAAYYPQKPRDDEKRSMNEFIHSFAQHFPCPECRADFQDEIQKSPPDVSDRFRLSNWMCEQHNIVNRKLGKDQFDCQRVLERWRYGPTDGRCD